MLNFATKLAPEASKLDRAGEAGFVCAEFWLHERHLRDVERLLAMVAGRAMRFVAHFPNAGNLGEREMDGAVWLYRGLGAKAMVIHKPMLRSYGSRLLKRAPELCLAVENGRQRGKDFEAWSEDHEWLTLDIEHVWKFTLRDCPLNELQAFVERFLNRHGAKVRHVHLPGYVPGAAEHRPAYFNPDLMRAMWDLLAGTGFEGLVVSELNPEFQTPDHLRRDLEVFEAWRAGRPRQSGGSQAELALTAQP